MRIFYKILTPIVAIFVLFLIIFIGNKIYKACIEPYGVIGAVEAEQVTAIAIQKKDISICDKLHLIGFADVTDSELREACYEKYASAIPTENICPRIDNNDRCVSARAMALNDPSICLMDTNDLQSLCVAYVAVKNQDVKMCSILTVAGNQKKCLQFFSSGI